MRKILVAMVAALLMGFGLVAVGSSPASAVECPYSGCVATTTKVKGPATFAAGTRPTLQIKVTAANDGRVSGLVAIACTKGAKKRFVSYGYRGAGTYKSYSAPKLGKGTWTCTVKFSDNWLYLASSDSTTLKGT